MADKDPYGKDAVVEILVRRDGMDKDEAQKLVDEFQQELKDLPDGTSFDEVQEMFEDYFGLEPDYLIAFLYEAM